MNLSVRRCVLNSSMDRLRGLWRSSPLDSSPLWCVRCDNRYNYTVRQHLDDKRRRTAGSGGFSLEHTVAFMGWSDSEGKRRKARQTAPCVAKTYSGSTQQQSTDTGLPPTVPSRMLQVGRKQQQQQHWDTTQLLMPKSR